MTTVRPAIFLLGSLLAASAARAGPADRPASPCSHGMSTMKVGGVDLDEMRCALATLQELRQNDQNTITGLLVKNQMLVSDLAAAQADAKKARGEAAKKDKPAPKP